MTSLLHIRNVKHNMMSMFVGTMKDGDGGVGLFMFKYKDEYIVDLAQFEIAAVDAIYVWSKVAGVRTQIATKAGLRGNVYVPVSMV
jgi:hypothetical protein